VKYKYYIGLYNIIKYFKKGYFKLIIVKFIKYSKEKSAKPFKIILKVFKQKE